MKLLVSVVSGEEVGPAIEGGADIIDVKNPQEGSLGAAQPSIIEEIIRIVGLRRETSCAIGDLPNLPGTVSLAAVGAASLSPDYIKLGLLGVSTRRDALSLVRNVVQAVRSKNPRVKVIACGYGDWELIGSVSPLHLPDIASMSSADGVLIDTINKDGRSLFDFVHINDLKSFVDRARDLGLISALAGSLRNEHADLIRICSPDVVGIRGAACTNNDRSSGELSYERIRGFRLNLS